VSGECGLVCRKKIQPWRDTGVEVRGPAVVDIEQAFAQAWATVGEPIPQHELVSRDTLAPAGDKALRVIATQPATTGMLRLGQLVAALAKNRLWLTDAYYAATPTDVQAIRAPSMSGTLVSLACFATKRHRKARKSAAYFELLCFFVA
jgi:cardiolipin synthase